MITHLLLSIHKVLVLCKLKILGPFCFDIVFAFIILFSVT